MVSMWLEQMRKTKKFVVRTETTRENMTGGINQAPDKNIKMKLPEESKVKRDRRERQHERSRKLETCDGKIEALS